MDVEAYSSVISNVFRLLLSVVADFLERLVQRFNDTVLQLYTQIRSCLQIHHLYNIIERTHIWMCSHLLRIISLSKEETIREYISQQVETLRCLI